MIIKLLKFNYDNFCNYCSIAKVKGKWISSKLLYQPDLSMLSGYSCSRC